MIHRLLEVGLWVGGLLVAMLGIVRLLVCLLWHVNVYHALLRLTSNGAHPRRAVHPGRWWSATGVRRLSTTGVRWRSATGDEVYHGLLTGIIRFFELEVEDADVVKDKGLRDENSRPICSGTSGEVVSLKTSFGIEEVQRLTVESHFGGSCSFVSQLKT